MLRVVVFNYEFLSVASPELLLLLCQIFFISKFICSICITCRNRFLLRQSIVAISGWETSLGSVLLFIVDGHAEKAHLALVVAASFPVVVLLNCRHAGMAVRALEMTTLFKMGFSLLHRHQLEAGRTLEHAHSVLHVLIPERHRHMHRAHRARKHTCTRLQVRVALIQGHPTLAQRALKLAREVCCAVWLVVVRLVDLRLVWRKHSDFFIVGFSITRSVFLRSSCLFFGMLLLLRDFVGTADSTRREFRFQMTRKAVVVGLIGGAS